MVGLGMSNPAKNEMDVDAFLVWGEGRDGRWELRDGQPVMMSPERAAHALTKLSAHIALINGVQRAGLRCRVFPDGMTVRIAARTAFEPDALVVCPPPIDLSTMEIPNPVIVVEVLAPSTAADDHGLKLAHIALINGVQRAGLRCRVFPDGMTVRIESLVSACAARSGDIITGWPS